MYKAFFSALNGSSGRRAAGQTLSRRNIAFLSVAFVALPGCASIRGSQERITAADFTTNPPICPSAEQLANPHPGIPDGVYRDNAISLCLKVIQTKYDAFKNALWVESATTNLGLDIAAQTLSSIGSIVDGATTVRRLAAGSAFAQGLGSTISKDLFYKQTLPALVASMDARRNRVITGILEAQNHDPAATTYTLARAGYDLDVLQQAGSLASAVQELTSSAVQNQAQTADEVRQAEIAINIGTMQPLSPAIKDRVLAVVAIIDGLERRQKTDELREIATTLEIAAPPEFGAKQLSAFIRIKAVSVSGSLVSTDQKETLLASIESAIQPYKELVK